MSAEQLLAELRALDIQIFAQGDRVRCNAPKGRLTSGLKLKIAAHKTELIRALQEALPQSAIALARPAVGERLPLSFTQERFWFLQTLDPGSTAYNITASRRVFTRIDAGILKDAVKDLIERHEILRSGFPELDGIPSQIVRENVSPEIEIHDLRHLNSEEQEAAAGALIDRLSSHRFDLAGDTLLRVSLLRLADEDHVLAVTMHHIICDGWSFGVLFTDLKNLYQDRASGAPAELKKLPLQYYDYVVRERDRQASAPQAAQLDYWKKKLAGAPPYLELPLDYARPESAGFAAALHRFELDETTAQSLREMARRDGATVFMGLLTVFKALLFRYTGQESVLVGTPVSTRTRAEFEQLIGCFINTHVLRTEVSGDLTARELLGRVRETVLGAVNNAEVPFETLVRDLVKERDLSRSPMFQIAFILQNTPLASEYDLASGGTAFDLTLYMWEAGGGIGGSIEYRSDLFCPETMGRFARCFVTLAKEMGAQPDVAIGRLAVLTRAQEEEWFGRENGSRAIYAGERCTQEWVEQQALKTPEAVAVVCGEERLSYRELSERSNRLAHRLRAMGVGAGTRVGLCLDRSVELAVAPLAVWKAGASYVPLDPEYPSQRVAFLLEDSGASVVVTEHRLLAKLPRELPAVLCLDSDWRLVERESAALPTPSATPDSVAYVIYTSGSTGKPKGVEVGHRSLVNFLASMQREPGMSASDRLLAVTTLSFDIAGLELYLPLVSGAQVVIAPRAAAFDGEALARLLNDSGITVMQATPVSWRLLVEAGWAGKADLKMLCGGEALPRELAERLLSRGAELWNLYGPTETTIWSTLQRVRSGAGRVPIGHPIANTQVYVMDSFGQPTPPGVAGELYIGGDGLAHGYLHQAELTAERFVPHPFHRGERLYRTGDVVRRLADGSLEWIARADHQVKLRGFRIELEEIERALEQQSGIKQAVVLVREEAGDARLVGYVTGAERSAADAAVLRKALLAVLPEYMIPSAFMYLPQFPLTPNKKIDRNALPAPKDPETTKDLGVPRLSDCVVPRNHVELVMTEAWRDVLGVDRVSVLDNFFELGGHSLTATRLIARMRSALKMDLPLRSIFEEPTIAGLAEHIAYDTSAKRYRYTNEIPPWNCLVPAQPRGTRTPFFFVAGYHAPDDTLLVLSQIIPHLGLDQPVFGLNPRWVKAGGEPYATVDEMAREFLAEVRAVQPTGPYLLGGFCVGGIAALEMAQILMREGEEVELLVLLDTERPTAQRIFLTDVYFRRKRIERVAGIVSEIVHADLRTKSRMVRNLFRRKLKIAQSPKVLEEARFYREHIRYRRLLYSHLPRQYRGRITVILNEHRARYDPNFGWEGVSQAGLDVFTIPGNHENILTDHGDKVGKLIRQGIDAALADTNRWRAGAKVKAS